MIRKLGLTLWALACGCLAINTGDTLPVPLAPSPVEIQTMVDGPNMKPEYRVFIRNGPSDGIPITSKVWDCSFIYQVYPCEYEVTP